MPRLIIWKNDYWLCGRSTGRISFLRSSFWDLDIANKQLCIAGWVETYYKASNLTRRCQQAWKRGGGVLGKSNEQWRKEATAHSAPEGAGYLRDTGLCRGRLDGATGPEDGAPFERFCPFPAGTAPVRAARPLGGSVPVSRRAFFPPAAAGRSSPPPAGSPRQARWPVWRPSWGEGAGRGLPARSPPSPALPRDALGQTGSENCWVRPV